jgi:hypothetical protein
MSRSSELIILSLSIIIAGIIVAAAFWFKPLSPPSPQTTPTNTPAASTKTIYTTSSGRTPQLNTSTTSTIMTSSILENELEIEELAFYRTFNAEGTKINVTLQFSVKNIGVKELIITEINIPDAGYTVNVSIHLNPGDTYYGTLQVIKNGQPTGMWNVGTKHLVSFTYIVKGSSHSQTVSGEGEVV